MEKEPLPKTKKMWEKILLNSTYGVPKPKNIDVFDIAKQENIETIGIENLKKLVNKLRNEIHIDLHNSDSDPLRKNLKSLIKDMEEHVDSIPNRMNEYTHDPIALARFDQSISCYNNIIEKLKALLK